MSEQEKGVVVGGAAGGLGQAVCAALREAGWQVCGVGRSAERLSVLGDGVRQVVADVSTAQGAKEAIRQAGEIFGAAPSGLVNCAGIVSLAPLHRITPEAWRACLSANLDTAFFSLAAFVDAARLAKQPAAAVLVSTVAARIGTPNHEAVAAAKAGVEGLVRAAAATYAPAGIRVNAVAPGIMDTPAVSGLIGTPAAREGAAMTLAGVDCAWSNARRARGGGKAVSLAGHRRSGRSRQAHRLVAVAGRRQGHWPGVGHGRRFFGDSPAGALSPAVAVGRRRPLFRGIPV